MSANDHDTNNESHGPADALGYGFRALVAKLHDQILVYTLAAAVLLVLAALVLPKGVRAPVFVGVGVLVLVGVVAWLYGRNQDTAERASGMRSGDIAIGRGVEVGPGAEVGSGDIHGSSDIHGPIETGDVTLRAGDRIQGTVRSGSVDVGGAHRPHSSTKRDGTPDDPSATS